MTMRKSYQLRDIVDEIRGISYGVVQPGNFVKNGIPYIRINNLTGGNLNLIDMVTIAPDIESKYKRTRLQGNELLVSLVGTLGEIGYVTDRMIGWNVARAIGVLPIKENFDRDWVYWYLKSPIVQSQFINNASTSVQATLNLSELQSIEINFPSDYHRRRSVDILSSLDDKIELNRQMNETLEEMAQAMFKHYFVDGVDRDNLPEGWRMGKLGDLFSLQNGFAFKSESFTEVGDYRVVKIKNINNNFVDVLETDFVNSSEYSTLNSKFEIRSGEYLIAMTGAEVGKTGIVPDHSDRLFLNQRVGALRDRILYGSSLGYTMLSQKTSRELILGLAIGSAQPNISGGDIESIECFIPGQEILLNVGKDINGFHKLIAAQLRETLTLQETRDYLLPKLISGEIIPAELNQLEQAL